MYHNNTSAKEIVRRTLVYTIMTLMVIGLIVVLLWHNFGYQFNSKDLKIEQNSLVQYDSFPRGAQVSIDGNAFNLTQTKGLIVPGQHQFTMKLNGYEPWQKTLDIKAGTVTHLVYARMIPEKKEATNLKEYPVLESAKFAPGGRFMAGVGVVNGTPKLFWGDVRSYNNPKFTETDISTQHLAQYDVATTKHQFAIAEWDFAGRYVLLKHIYTPEGSDSKIQWLRFDRDNPKEMIDVTNIASVDILDAHFIGTNGNELYVLQNGGHVRQMNVAGASLSRPVLSGVQSFVLYGSETIAYVGTEANVKVAGVWKKGWEQSRIMYRAASAQTDDVVKIKASKYFNKDTVVVTVNDTAQIYRGDLRPPTEDSEAVKKFLNSVKKVAFGRTIKDLTLNSDGRMVILKDETGFVNYDIERETISPVIALDAPSELKWLDEFYVWRRDASGKLLIQEFDGTNAHTLTPVAAGYDAALSPDGKYLYSFVSDGDKLILSRLKMTTES